MNFIQRIMVQHANPRKLTIDAAGVIVATYFLWQRNLPLALIVLFGFSIIGTLLVWGRSEEKLAETPLGKWMLGQAHPMNLAVRSVGAIIISYGLWVHSIAYIFIGIVLVIIARHWVLKPHGQ